MHWCFASPSLNIMLTVKICWLFNHSVVALEKLIKVRDCTGEDNDFNNCQLKSLKT